MQCAVGHQSGGATGVPERCCEVMYCKMCSDSARKSSLKLYYMSAH